MDTKSALKMVRSGEFDIHTYGENHCGTAEEFKIRYHLICECSPKLDKRGFLFDQINIQSYFESIKRTQLSCERLTVVCLEQLLEHILSENPACQIYKMELTLSPEPFLASMTHSLENDDDFLGKGDKSVKPGKATTVSNKRIKKDKEPVGDRLFHLPTTVDGSEATSGDESSKDEHSHAPSHDHYVFQEPES